MLPARAGTVSYCAPELLKEGKLTKAADVYSFAMIMWEMYSGTALFRGMNSSQVSSFTSKMSDMPNDRDSWTAHLPQYHALSPSHVRRAHLSRRCAEAKPSR